MNESDEIFFAAENNEDERYESSKKTWKILIVDDEEDVHRVTRLVLSDIEFTSCYLEFFSCYSGGETREFLKKNHDIAVILLDVVMEEDDTGLKLVKYIREEIRNTSVRIILRTGQPGQAPEHNVILDYDINDYKSKTELTSEKLFTTIISALRNYRDLQIIEKSRKGLEKIIEASANIFELQSMNTFVKGILLQFVSILGFEEDAILCNTSGISAVNDDGVLMIIAATGKYNESIINRPVNEVMEKTVADHIENSFRRKKSIYEKNIYIGYYKTEGGFEHLVYLEKSDPIEDYEKNMIELFNSNIGVAFENIYLNQELENIVEERTMELQLANNKLFLKNRLMERELDTARRIQESMIPREFIKSENIFIDGRYIPVQSLGGDYYDVFYLSDTRIGIVIADVSGHGVSASLIATMAKMSFTNNVYKNKSTADVLNAVHTGMYSSVGKSGMFMTVFYCVIDIEKMEMEYSSGGHNEIIVLKEDCRMIDLLSLDTIVGIFPEEKYSSSVINLDPGDKIILYTDGLIEAKNSKGEFVGAENFHRIIRENYKLKPDKLITAILNSVQAFTGDEEIDDDRTILIAEILKTR
ncbi:MAG: DUF3369 domain-containing protein [Spirochaetes bacterium]|nr:DUF3369 domain-containing protein [Spirochaetota bacterium]